MNWHSFFNFLDWEVIVGSLPNLLAGAQLTIYIAVFGLIGGGIVGAVTGLARAYGDNVSRAAAMLYVGLFRGTPLLVQLMFIYFALPGMLGIRMDAITASILTIALNSGSYIAEIVRGAFLSVSRGLAEAGLALGLPKWRVLMFVLGPVAIRRMIPSLGNQCIISLKDTSLVSVLGIGELVRRGQEEVSASFMATEVWASVAVIYLIIIGAMALVLRLIEQRMRIL